MDPFRNQYRELSDTEKSLVESIKNQATALYLMINSMPAGREQSLAKTKLEESVMWAVKGITQ